MSFKKIRDLDAASTLTNGLSKNDFIPTADASGNTTVKATAQEIVETTLGDTSSFTTDTNGNLVLKDGAVTADALSADALSDPGASVDSSAQAESLTDLQGTELTISTEHFGEVGAIVIGQHPMASDDGPTPKTVTFSNNSTTATCASLHGFAIPDSSIRQAVQFSTTGSLPSNLDTVTTYYAQQAGTSTTQFNLYTSRTGGTAITFQGAGTGTHKVSRNATFALNAGNYSGGTYSANEFGAYWWNMTTVTVNWVFKTVEGAYTYLIRNSQQARFIFYINTSVHRESDWNNSSDNRFAVDYEFTKATSVKFVGNRWNASTNNIEQGMKSNTQHYAYDHCRVRVTCGTRGGVAIWFREATASLYFIAFLFDGTRSDAVFPNECVRFGELGSFENCSLHFRNWSGINFSGRAAIAVGEGANTFTIGDILYDMSSSGSGNAITDGLAANLRYIATFQGGRAYAQAHGGKWAVVSPGGASMVRKTYNWLYVNAVQEVDLMGDGTHNSFAAREVYSASAINPGESTNAEKFHWTK